MNGTKHQEVKEAARDAVNSGSEIYEQIRTITIKALTDRQLDTDNIRAVTDEVVTGISNAMTTQGEQTITAFMQAISALDEALAVAAEASKLAIEEAASRVSEYSEQDLTQAREDLKTMEGLFLETLEKAAKGGNHIAAGIVTDFLNHTRQSGTAVGKHVLTALESLQNLPQMGLSTTVAAASTLAQIGSNILAGIADSLHSSPHKH